MKTDFGWEEIGRLETPQRNAEEVGSRAKYNGHEEDVGVPGFVDQVTVMTVQRSVVNLLAVCPRHIRPVERRAQIGNIRLIGRETGTITYYWRIQWILVADG